MNLMMEEVVYVRLAPRTDFQHQHCLLTRSSWSELKLRFLFYFHMFSCCVTGHTPGVCPTSLVNWNSGSGIQSDEPRNFSGWTQSTARHCLEAGSKLSALPYSHQLNVNSAAAWD